MSTIHVPLTVERHALRLKDGLVEVWGRVGDYEVMVCLTLLEAARAALEVTRKARGVTLYLAELNGRVEWVSIPEDER